MPHPTTRKEKMPYILEGPWRNETWGARGEYDPYSRLAGRRFNGGTINGTIPISMTDIPRGIALLVTGTTVTENQYPSQDDLANADYYFLGGHVYTVSDTQAAILTAAGYGNYLTPVV